MLRKKLEVKNGNFLILIHRMFVNGRPKRGGVDIIIDFLLEKNKKIYILEHSLECNKDSSFKIVERDREDIIKFVKLRFPNPPLRWVVEVFQSVKLIVKSFKYIPYCIAVDPLNGITAIILKKLGKVGKIYFHCIDYSENRFGNKLLNRIYILLYYFSLRRSNICGVVSKRMMDKFLSAKIPKEKLFYIPNSPLFVKWNIDFRKRNKFDIVITAVRIDCKTDFEKIIRVLSRLRMNFPLVKLKIIGASEDKKFLRDLKDNIKKYGVEDCVFFLGFFPEPKDLQQILVNNGIGITAYIPSKAGHFGFYGDSLKIREYALCGLPIVADDMCSTAFEAEEYKCGFVTINEGQMYMFIKRLLENTELYEEYSKNAIKWAEKFDKRKILERLLIKLRETS